MPRLLLCGLLLLPLLAQAVLFDRHNVDDFLSKLGSDQQADVSHGVDWGIIPGPFYTPELGVGVGVAAVGLYRPDTRQQHTPLSTLSLSGFASSTGAFGLGYENSTFLQNDRWRFYLEGDLSHRPLRFWGVGYQAGHSQRGKQSYDASRFSAQPQLLYQLAAHTYAGVGWSLAYERASELQNKPSGSLFVQPSLAVFSSGGSLLFSYDTRDFLANPSRGQVLNLSYTRYSTALGGDNRFKAWDAQYGTYHGLNDSTLLAWELYGRITDGNVPWTMLSQLGDSHHLRGYFQGRYRDRDMLTSQLELRKKLSWRHGVVAWLGAGTLSSRESQLLNGHWLPSVGVGYRFEFKKRMNVRLDYGLGQHSSGFYFQVGEAF